ncbi:IS30 family transposase [Lentilactobacillus sp. TOM.63]|uniref:IS30 family transposase n=1 Tax=Lentilactobacillus sp. TOM.63 TaxID=3055077 RepID=UPI00201C1B56|nr:MULTISPECIES: IS30 family transposase [Lentilactobacillus]MDM7516830.1 IS30 family transposase [Lentilactobacillus sp. TOM.63]
MPFKRASQTLLVQALRERPRIQSVDSFVHYFSQIHPTSPEPSTPTVYRYIDRGLLPIKNADLPEKLRRRIKRPGKHHERLNKKRLGASIEKRPTSVLKREHFGDWEGDLAKGRRVSSEPAILTLTERYSRYEIMIKLPNYHAQTCYQALQETIRLYGSAAFNSITFDNGAEFAKLNQVKGTQIYYAHPYSPWERGTNENHNGLIREYIPKGKSLHHYEVVSPKCCT